MEGETSLIRQLSDIMEFLHPPEKKTLCHLYPFYSYTEVDPAVIAGDGVEMFKNEVMMKMGFVYGIL